MPVDRSTWRQHLRYLIERCPGPHPYTLAIRLEVDGYRGITGKQVADAMRQFKAQET
jgi:hypothetical protein